MMSLIENKTLAQSTLLIQVRVNQLKIKNINNHNKSVKPIGATHLRLTSALAGRRFRGAKKEEKI